MSTNTALVVSLSAVRNCDINQVGGKNASLGEMLSMLSESGVRVPGGFATTASAFQGFLDSNGLTKKIEQIIKKLDVDNITQLKEVGGTIRSWISAGNLQPELDRSIREEYLNLSKEAGLSALPVAVRSSATAEDLPDASFAGQQETYLNVVGEDHVIDAVKQVYASLFTDRAIAYRAHRGFSDSGFSASGISLSVGIQRMVRSDLAASGVMFSLDTESGFEQVVFITSSYGLGELVVQGAVNPDEFYAYKPSINSNRPAIIRRQLGSKLSKLVLNSGATFKDSVRTLETTSQERRNFSISDEEVVQLARYAILIERHYGRPMDIEWAKDGNDGKLYIVQARPETVTSRAPLDSLQRYKINQGGPILVTGRAIGQKIGTGKVSLIKSPKEMEQVKQGDVLVTDMTDPDWEPVMKRASAIVTNRGGRTCHAAIIARELGIPAVVGTGDATSKLSNGATVTVSCAEGDEGKVYQGKIDFEVSTLRLDALPETPVKISMNVGNPELAFDFQRLPNAGVGLARIEFVIARMIGIHPRAALDYPILPEKLKSEIEQRSAGYKNPVSFYVEKLAEGISTLGAAFFPKPVIVRLSDFKTNEYSGLLGGDKYEPKEENPMLGFRGASRYISESFRECFELECSAVRMVRDEMGLTNIEVMIPFVRTIGEAQGVIELLAKNGLERGKNGLRIIMMCEVPSNAILADQFLEYFDGFSIGSNDMTQLTLGLDRDSGLVAQEFDERDPAVKAMLSLAIKACRKVNKYCGICGQGPSDYPDLADWLVSEGIDSLSLNPDTVLDTWIYLSKVQRGNRDRR